VGDGQRDLITARRQAASGGPVIPEFGMIGLGLPPRNAQPT
jgi:hypothetical protein